jgi:hypothetical protein
LRLHDSPAAAAAALRATCWLERAAALAWLGEAGVRAEPDAASTLPSFLAVDMQTPATPR